MTDTRIKKHQAGRQSHWSDYIPLIVLVLTSATAARAMQHGYRHPFEWKFWMLDFMGFFLVVFAMFKFFDLSGFADGFQMYDLLAKPFRSYAYAYPFIEACLGLSYLAHWHLTAAYILTIVVMTFGSLGVFAALKKGLNLECACLGSILHVPLSTVALVEDLGMAAMAFIMLLTDPSINGFPPLPGL